MERFRITINGSKFLDWVQVVRLYKHRFKTAEAFLIRFDNLYRHYPGATDLIREQWNQLEPMSVAEIFEFTEKNKRSPNTQRLFFQVVGPQAIFNELANKNRLDARGVDIKFQERDGSTTLKHEIYELWHVADPRLPGEEAGVIVCRDTTTEKTHYLYCSHDGPHMGSNGKGANALAAIASLCYSPYKPSDIAEIHRQGEQYVFIPKKPTCQIHEELVPLDEKTYWSKIKFQS